MKLLKWITHPVNLLLVIIVVAIYLNRAELFGTAESVAGDDSHSTATDLDSPSEIVQSVDTAAVPVATNTTAETDVPRVEEMAPTSAAEPAASGAVSEGVVQARETASPSEEPPVTMAVTTDPAETWRQARLAAWQGELELAVKRYRELAEQAPQSIDAYGEMGNVLMRMGDWSSAADAYQRAALRAAGSGELRTAWYLHSVVAGLDPQRAAELRKEIAGKNR